MKRVPLWMAVLMTTVLLVGCGERETGTPGTGGGSGGIDLTTPISELKAAAADMDLATLQNKAKQYMDQITTKQADLEKLMSKFSAIPIAEKMGDEAKDLQGEITGMTDSISKLRERFQVYVDYIKEKGGDISQFKL